MTGEVCHETDIYDTDISNPRGGRRKPPRVPGRRSPSQAVVARDPGVRGGPSGAGGAIAGLTAQQQAYFNAGKEDFDEAEEIDDGIGPRMNLDSCGGCHSQPAAAARVRR